MGKKSRKKYKSGKNIKDIIEESKKSYVKPKSGFKIKKYIPLLVIVAIIIGAVFIIRYVNTLPGKYDDFAMCLKESGVKFYGSFQCTHCKEQKNMFGRSIRYVPYIECGPLSGFTNQECIDAEIDGVPSWKFADGAELSGTRQLSEIAEYSGCSLN